MKNVLSAILFLVTLVLSSCSGSSKTGDYDLDAVSYAEKINQLPNAPIIDVRTSEEFSDGHLRNAKNIDWSGNDFDAEIDKLNKENPVFVYCLSGGRSHSAAEKMRSLGFKAVYELDGGIIKWRAANLPEANVNNGGLTTAEFTQLLNTDKKVLIDFYADWCEPCKKMAPYLEAMKTEMADSVIIVRINADKNQGIAKTLKVDELPTLLLFKNKATTWTHTGFIEKDELVKKINSY